MQHVYCNYWCVPRPTVFLSKWMGANRFGGKHTISLRKQCEVSYHPARRLSSLKGIGRFMGGITDRRLREDISLQYKYILTSGGTIPQIAVVNIEQFEQAFERDPSSTPKSLC